MRPRSLKEAVELVQAGENDCVMLAEFLAEFYVTVQRRNAGDRRGEPQEMIEGEPPITGKQPFDAYVGAVGEHLARRWGLEIPAWVEDLGVFSTRLLSLTTCN